MAIEPIVSLIAGILILLVPRLLNYIVALYLIVAGALGLGAMSGSDAAAEPYPLAATATAGH